MSVSVASKVRPFYLASYTQRTSLLVVAAAAIVAALLEQRVAAIRVSEYLLTPFILATEYLRGSRYVRRSHSSPSVLFGVGMSSI